MDLVIDTWEQWCQVFNKAEVWRPFLLEIGKRIGLPVTEVRPGYEGTNAVFIVNEQAVFKIMCPYFPGDYERELEIYHLLEKDGDLPTPRVLAQGVLHEAMDWPYMVLSYLPGERLGEVWPRVPREDQLAIARQFGAYTQRLHGQPLEGITSLDTSREHWIGFVQSQIEGAVDYFRSKGLPAPLIEALPEYLRRVQPLYPPDFQPCLLSADLTEDHELLTFEDGHWRITGLIDFGDAEVGHADFDFVCVNLFCFPADQELLRAFLDGYGHRPDERFNLRMMGYSLLHRFSDMQPWIDQLGGPERVRSWEQLQRHLWQV